MRYALLFFIASALHGEIQNVLLQFNPVNCQRGCTDLLAKQFRRISGIQDVSISPQQGLVTLKYAPNAAFAFQPINVAVRTVGPNLEWIQLTVRGTVEVSGNRAILTSIGDNNRFQIIAPGQQSPQGINVEYNIASHTLNSSQLAMLSDLLRKRRWWSSQAPFSSRRGRPPTT